MKLHTGLSLLIAVCLSGAVFAQPITRAWPRNEPLRLPDSGLRSSALNCTDVDSLTFGDLPDIVTVSGSNVGADNLASSYSCETWSEEGGEVVYKVILTEEALLTAELTTQPVDLDLFLLDGCHSDNCLIAGSSAFSISLEAGVYWLVVDGYHGAEGAFDLMVEARTTGVPASVCDSAIAIPTRLGLWTDDESSCFDKENLLQAYDCSPTPEVGGEVWYRCELPSDCTFTAEMTPPNFDGALWLFIGCDGLTSPAQCVDFSDDRTSGGSEDVSWSNDTDETVSLVLAADAYAPPTSLFSGLFTLEIDVERNSAICDEEDPGIIDLAVELAPVAVTGNLSGQPNALPLVDCLDDEIPGGEVWYRLTVPARASGSITLLPVDFDGVLLRFDDCSASASCAGEGYVADAGGVNAPETLSFDNPGTGDLVFFLVVDSRDADAAAYTLEWSDIVPTTTTTGGSLRRHFR